MKKLYLNHSFCSYEIIITARGVLFIFQNVLFFALSDDIPSAKQKLLIKENDEFDIVFPGVGDISSPGDLI